MDFPGFRKNFATSELSDYLRSEFNLDDITVGRLLDEEIDGLALLELTELDLRELGIRKMGTLKKIQLLIRQNSAPDQQQQPNNSFSSPRQFPQSTPNRVSSESQISNAVFEVMKRIGTIQNNPKFEVQENSFVPPLSPVAQISSTTPFVPDPVDIKPVIDLTEQSPSTSTPFVQNPASPADVPEVITLNIANASTPINPKQAKRSKNEPRRYTLKDSFPDSNNTSESSRPKRKRKYPLTYDILDSHYSCSNDTTSPEKSPSITIQQNNKPTSSEDLPRILNVTSLEHKKMKLEKVLNSEYKLPEGVTFENLDLRKEIAKIQGYHLIIKDLIRDGQINRSVHRRFVQVAVSIMNMLSERIGYKKYYPPSHHKTQMARAIIRSFPNLAETDSTRPAFAAYYDGKARSGFIENRFKTLRRASIIEKKRTGRELK
ncbi:uncharacterized protein LOC120336951 [Styela clava]